jgi:hypothetical protein
MRAPGGENAPRLRRHDRCPSVSKWKPCCFKISSRAGGAGPPVVTVTQPRYAWLDLGELEDVIIYADVREVTNTVTLNLQTAPAAADSVFVTMSSIATLATGVQTLPAIGRMAALPVARFLRWSLSGAVAGWDTTFRIWVAGYGFA